MQSESVAPVSNRCFPQSEVEMGRAHEPQAQVRGSSPSRREREYPVRLGRCALSANFAPAVARKILTESWGATEFRPLQLEAIEAAVRDEDSLVILPTGRGKSLCYQIPTMMNDRLSVVVCPLISLMKDQVDACNRRRIPAAFINSQQSPREQEDVARRSMHGDLRLLYLSPERLLQPPTLSMLNRLQTDGRLQAFVIDEAHCIAEWGHDFRPDYRRLSELRTLFPKIRLNAFTATATPTVRSQIIEALGLRTPTLVIGDVSRPNLFLRVEDRDSPFDQVFNYIVEHADQAGIVYCPTRAETERLSYMLCERDISSASYHAGLDPAARSRVQEWFSNRELDIVVATVAFGMGIDRPDVRYVLHSSMPPSLDQYHQEIGRAGRDGQRAECVIFYHPHDVNRWDELFASDGLDDDRLNIKRDYLRNMAEYCSEPVCRHRTIAEHFGQPWENQPAGCVSDGLCNACDVCMEMVG